jgi:uncharacterized integral membrane protein
MIMTEQTLPEPKYYRIRKRPWYEWLAWLVWLVLLVFLVQNALGSSTELEPRAAMIFWVSAGVVLLAGIVIGFVRSKR